MTACRQLLVNNQELKHTILGDILKQSFCHRQAA